GPAPTAYATLSLHDALPILHADQIQGFFDIPVDNVYSSPILLSDIWRARDPNVMVVSPDVGGVVRARALAKRLDDADLAIIDKRDRKSTRLNSSHVKISYAV